MKKAFLQLHAAILLAASSSILGKLISLDAIFTTWYRMMFASFILILLYFITKQSYQITKKEILVFFVGILLALHWILFYGSIKYSNVSIGVICFCLSGFFTAVLSPLIRRQKVNMSEMFLSSLILAGISLIFHFDSSYRLGIILGVISSLLFSIYVIANEKVNREIAALKAITLQMVSGTICVGILLPLYNYIGSTKFIFPNFIDFVFLFLLALGCTVCMCLLLNNAQKKLNAFTVSLSFNLEPVYSIVLAILLFQEDKQLSMSFYLGLSLIILSLLLQMYFVVWQRNKNVYHLF